MELKSLGYIGLGGQDLGAWREFSKRLLGTQASDGDRYLTLRMDEKCHRFIIAEEQDEPHAYFGFEVLDASEIDKIRARLKKNNITVTNATPHELATRKVQRMAWFCDPDQNRIEVYSGLATAETPLAPDRPIGGFRTGGLGLGHVVFIVDNLERARDFYCDLLGFKVSDYVLTPTRRVFMHINGRHHTVALAERAGGGIAHVMVEVNEFDDVGRAYDVALKDYRHGIYSTLGRHSNDHVTSFYVMTPAGFPLEYGWGGRLVDDSTWKVENLFGPSLWGHDRLGGNAESRTAANEQREIAFREGLRAPLAVIGNSHGN